jgi:hypothetical protein
MSRRTLLSSEQRTRLFGIPTEAAEMAKHYVLSAEDLALVRAKRRPNNRLGYAVQLCVLRHPGRPLDPSEVTPAAMLAFVANQVGGDPKLFGDYAHRAETRREHLLELQQYLRLRSFRLADWRTCLHVGAKAAWATDRGEPIVRAMLAHLRAERVLVPAAAVLERIGLAARVRARKRVFQALAEGMTDAAREALEKLLIFDPCQIQHRSRVRVLHAGLRALQPVLYAGDRGDRKRGAIRPRRPDASRAPNRSAHP